MATPPPNPYPVGSAQAAAYTNAQYVAAKASGIPIGTTTVNTSTQMGEASGVTVVMNDGRTFHNVINSERFVAGVSSGLSTEQLYALQGQRPPIQQQPQRQQTQQQYAQQAVLLAQKRPGYYPTSMLGDSETQRRIAAGERPDVVLESQRQKALLTPTRADDRFFENELSKYAQRDIETSSAYHAMGMEAGVPIPANPFEHVGDIALALQKGGNPKDFGKNYAYAFNPAVGVIIGTLPNGQGLQETAWTSARTGEPSRVDFMPALNYLESQRGKQGVYGNLWGGVPDKPAPVERSPASVVNAGLPKGVLFTGGISTVPKYGGEQIPPAPGETVIPAKRGSVSTSNIPGLNVLGMVGLNFDIPTPEGTWDVAFNRPTVVTTTKGEPTTNVDGTVTTVYTSEAKAGKSAFDLFQEDKSNRLYSAVGSLGGLSGEQYKAGMQKAYDTNVRLANVNPIFIPLAASIGAGKAVFDRPIDVGVNVGVGAAVTWVFAGIGAAGSAVAATRVGTAIPGVTKAAGVAWRYGVPTVMAGVYGHSVSSRATDDFTNFKPGDVSGKAGGILAVETVPMIMGGYAAQSAPAAAGFVYRSAVKTPGKVSDAVWASRQRMSGITRLEHGTTPYDIAVKPRVPQPPQPSGGVNRPTSIDEILARDAIHSDLYVTRATKTYREPFTGGMNRASYDIGEIQARGAIRDDVFVTRATKTYREPFEIPVEYAGSTRFYNDNGMSAWGGTKRKSPSRQFVPEMQRSEPIYTPLNPKRVYAEPEPITINLKTADELGASVPAVYRSQKPIRYTEPSLARRLKTPNSQLELERLDYAQRERGMLGIQTVTQPVTRSSVRTRSKIATLPSTITGTGTRDITRPDDRTRLVTLPTGTTTPARKRLVTTEIVPTTGTRRTPFVTPGEVTRTTPKPITITTTEPKPPKPVPVIIPFILPTVPRAGSAHAVRRTGAYKFRERSPTWTPEEMARATLTGSFRPLPRRQARPRKSMNVNIGNLAGVSIRKGKRGKR